VQGGILLRVLITGGNGFIGSHLAQRLMNLGHDVTLLDLSFGRNTKELSCAKISGDVCEDSTFKLVKEFPDIVVHAAAVSRVEWGENDPKTCLRTNVIGFLNVLHWAQSSRVRPHVILASSREVYGEPAKFPVTEDWPKQPKSVYGTSKLASEQLLAHFGLVDELKYTIVRFSNVYGSMRDLPQRVIPRFMKSALEGEPLILNGGSQVLDFTFIDDVIDGLTSLISRVGSRTESVINNDFHFCSGQGTSIRELAELIKEVTASKSEIIVSPSKRYDVVRFIGDSSKAQRSLGFRITFNIRSGLKEYADRVEISRGNA
jgi:nucleoside-diphosphate-sugar epimerase